MARYSLRVLQLSDEINAGSTPVREAFLTSTAILEPLLTTSSLTVWMAEGAALVGRGARYWDAAAEYFRASPTMAQRLSTRRLLQWVRAGRPLADVSGNVVGAFYRASPGTVLGQPQVRFDAWASMGQRLFASTDYADTLACRFFDASPRFLQTNSLQSLDLLGILLAQVAGRSLDLAVDVLNLSARLFPELNDEDLNDFLTMGSRLARRNLNAVRAYFDAGLGLYVRLGRTERDAFLDVIQALAATSPRGLATYLSEASRHLGPIVAERGVQPLLLSARIAGLSTPAAREFIRNASVLVDRLTNQQLAEWCRQGEALLVLHEAAGIGYFRLQSREALEAISAISPIVELEDVREVLRLYCQALMGRTIAVVPAEQVSGERASSWAAAEEPDLGGTTIFAPSRMQDFETKENNFEAYKVLATHQAGHLEFGTFDFVFDRPGQAFGALRVRIAELQAHDRSYFTDFDRFFDVFTDRHLARDTFTIAEDTRIDYQLRTEYRGIRTAYRRVQEHAVVRRPELGGLPLREQVVEILLRMSLEHLPVHAVPRSIAGSLWVAAGIINWLARNASAVEDAAEATLRLYTVLRFVPNEEPKDVPDTEWVTLDLSEAAYDPAAEDLDSLFHAFLKANESPEQPPLPGQGDQDPDQQPRQDEEEYSSPSPVSHRGDLRPELAQAMQKLQRQARRDAGQPDRADGQAGGDDEDIPLELLQEWADNLDDMFAEWTIGNDMNEGLWPTMLLGNLLRNRSGQQQNPPKPLVQPDGPYKADPDLQTFIYDEWDYRAKAYRPKWCSVRQRTLKEVDGGTFFADALAGNRSLVHAVRRQFEMLRPELLGRVKRLLDGEEFDLDAVMEARVERRAGQTPTDKIYWKRNKVERNVAVALLLDMSLSTDERIEREASRVAREAATERARLAANKRIIDLEREGLVLFIEALEQIRDTYGIYGFSGSGREDVQFYVIKDYDEPLSDRIRRRVDGIVPLQGTRMGPAIRHTISKLEKVPAKTKVLIVLSDGRPQDRDYGTLPWDPEALPRSFLRPGDYGIPSFNRDALMLDEKEYAVHDTKQALNEAKAKNITPFCISVDKQGHDYLKEMCGDIGYEVVSDIESLPRRLPSLYRRLTT